MSETAVIERMRRLAAALSADGVELGIGDDAALLTPVSAGHELVVCVDTLNEGVHFLADHAPDGIGHKALAVNLSDLAAMGASPRWATLSLSLPEVDPAWVNAFCAGFQQLAGRYELALVGGDTTRGPRSISVTVGGSVEQGQALRRGAAQPGERLWVSGTLGDAAAALAGFDAERFQQRLQRPTPRVDLGRALRGLATSCIDLSDGLGQDLPRLLAECGACVELDALPLSAALQAAADQDARWQCAVAGGDDYELCFTASADRGDDLARLASHLDLPLTCIGEVTASGSIDYRRADGSVLPADRFRGFEHFS